MAITVNIYYTGEGTNARKFAEEMVSSGTVGKIRAEAGNLRYEYFFPMDDQSTVLLIDSWVDGGTLDMLAKKHKGVAVTLITSPRGDKLAPSDIAKFAAQYGVLDVKTSTSFHDRFLILDDKELYLIGASLKDLGKKCFGFTKMDPGEIPCIKARV